MLAHLQEADGGAGPGRGEQQARGDLVGGSISWTGDGPDDGRTKPRGQR